MGILQGLMWPLSLFETVDVLIKVTRSLRVSNGWTLSPLPLLICAFVVQMIVFFAILIQFETHGFTKQ